MGVIRELRDMVPIRPLGLAESLRVAELQATRLLKLSGVTEGPVPESVVTELPRVQVERVWPLGAAGFTQWAKGRWLLVINERDYPTRQRFSLMHEFKHVLDDPFIRLLYPPEWELSAADRAELACDHFAACVLMPRPWVKRAWASGVQDPSRLAALFDVSQEAMDRRLRNLGLAERRSPRSRHRLVA